MYPAESRLTSPPTPTLSAASTPSQSRPAISPSRKARRRWFRSPLTPTQVYPVAPGQSKWSIRMPASFYASNAQMDIINRQPASQEPSQAKKRAASTVDFGDVPQKRQRQSFLDNPSDARAEKTAPLIGYGDLTQNPQPWGFFSNPGDARTGNPLKTALASNESRWFNTQKTSAPPQNGQEAHANSESRWFNTQKTSAPLQHGQGVRPSHRAAFYQPQKPNGIGPVAHASQPATDPLPTLNQATQNLRQMIPAYDAAILENETRASMIAHQHARAPTPLGSSPLSATLPTGTAPHGQDETVHVPSHTDSYSELLAEGHHKLGLAWQALAPTLSKDQQAAALKTATRSFMTARQYARPPTPLGSSPLGATPPRGTAPHGSDGTVHGPSKADSYAQLLAEGQHKLGQARQFLAPAVSQSAGRSPKTPAQGQQADSPLDRTSLAPRGVSDQKTVAPVSQATVQSFQTPSRDRRADDPLASSPLAALPLSGTASFGLNGVKGTIKGRSKQKAAPSVPKAAAKARKPRSRGGKCQTPLVGSPLTAAQPSGTRSSGLDEQNGAAQGSRSPASASQPHQTPVQVHQAATTFANSPLTAVSHPTPASSGLNGGNYQQNGTAPAQVSTSHVPTSTSSVSGGTSTQGMPSVSTVRVGTLDVGSASPHPPAQAPAQAPAQPLAQPLAQPALQPQPEPRFTTAPALVRADPSAAVSPPSAQVLLTIDHGCGSPGRHRCLDPNFVPSAEGDERWMDKINWQLHMANHLYYNNIRGPYPIGDHLCTRTPNASYVKKASRFHDGTKGWGWRILGSNRVIFDDEPRGNQLVTPVLGSNGDFLGFKEPSQPPIRMLPPADLYRAWRSNPIAPSPLQGEDPMWCPAPEYFDDQGLSAL